MITSVSPDEFYFVVTHQAADQIRGQAILTLTSETDIRRVLMAVISTSRIVSQRQGKTGREVRVRGDLKGYAVEIVLVLGTNWDGTVRYAPDGKKQVVYVTNLLFIE